MLELHSITVCITTTASTTTTVTAVTLMLLAATILHCTVINASSIGVDDDNNNIIHKNNNTNNIIDFSSIADYYRSGSAETEATVHAAWETRAARSERVRRNADGPQDLCALASCACSSGQQSEMVRCNCNFTETTVSLCVFGLCCDNVHNLQRVYCTLEYLQSSVRVCREELQCVVAGY